MPSRPVSRRSVLLGAGAAAGGAVIDALVIEPNWLDVAIQDVPVEGLPRALDGFSLAQVTDAHLTTLGMVEAAIVEALRVHDVQLVTLTGDIIDSERHLPVLQELCGSLRGTGARVIATLGNWEHWGGVRLTELAGAYADTGARLLVNETAVLADGVAVCATDDSTGGRVQLRKALDGATGDTRVLLTHSPELLDRVPMSVGPFALGLAGHTHGGQVRAGSGIVPFVPPGSGRFVAGWYDTPAGRAYVSRGTGTSIAPARFTCRPELPIFRLRQG